MNRRSFLQTLTASAAPLRADTNRTRLTVVLDSRVGKISRHVYGHFAEHLGGCVYDGMWVGPGSKVANIGGLRKDTIDCLKRIKAPMIRWPGGCFADEY